MKSSALSKRLIFDASREVRANARQKCKEIIDFMPTFTDTDIRAQLPHIDISTLTTRYIDSMGYAPLRYEIARQATADSRYVYTEANVIITPGSIYALHALAAMLFDVTDKVYLPKPYWYGYKNVFGLFCQVTHTLDNDVSAIIINDPSYCGTVLSEDELSTLYWFAIENNAIIIKDNIFKDYRYDEPVQCQAEAYIPQDNVFLVYSPSKSLNVGGWRVGACVGAEDAIKLLYQYQMASTYGASVMSQVLYCDSMILGLRPDKEKAIRKRDMVVDAMTAVGINIKPPMGGNAIMIPCEKWYKRFNVCTDYELCERFIDELSVIVGPGTNYGTPDFIYMCYCIPYTQLEEGLKRLCGCLKC